MGALHIKLLRDLRRLWAQVLAIALVMAAGVMTLIVGVGAYDSLATTRDRYYESNRFADIFADVTRAPNALADSIAAIGGVAAVETRIVKLALADMQDMAEPGSVMLVSLPAFRPQTLNRVYLRSGRLPESAAEQEAMVSEGFAKAHRLSEGSRFQVLMNGRQRTVVVTGIALSPEYVYALGPGDIVPDERRFGIVWMPERTLAAAYDLDGAFSNVIVKLLPGASEPRVIAELDRVLARYGGRGAYGRKDQLSHAFLDAELNQLRGLAEIVPPIFLSVAAFLVNMTMARLIALEREQIGLFKALGYSSWGVALHYIEFVALVALIGIVIGFAAGIWLGNGLTILYAKFYNFPFLVFSRDPSIYAIAALVTLAASVAGAIKAVTDVAWLPPAIAMSPPAPPRYRKMLPDAIDITGWMRQSNVMVARHLLRWPLRSGGAVLGVAFAVSTLAGSLWSFGSIDFLLNANFHRLERQDATISFTEAQPIAALYEAGRLPGVLRAEPFRAADVRVKFGYRERKVAIVGKRQDAELSRVLDTQFDPVSLPASGIVLSKALADILHARTGDKVEVDVLEGDRRTVMQPVSAIVAGFVGLSANMDLDALNRMLGEDQIISGVYLSYDPRQEDKLFAALKRSPSARFIALQKTAEQKFKETAASNVTATMTVYVMLGAVIAFGVVYNFARIALSEQGREMASLRVLGFTRGEVSSLLLTELAAVVLVAQPLGWLIGYALGLLIIGGLNTELYQFPYITGPNVFAYGSIVVMGAAIVSALIVRRRVDRLDMIEVLKTRE